MCILSPPPQFTTIGIISVSLLFLFLNKVILNKQLVLRAITFLLFWKELLGKLEHGIELGLLTALNLRLSG